MIGRDPGLQPERTALAWVRTASSLLVVALLLLRAGFASSSGSVVVAGTFLMVCAAATYGLALYRQRRLVLDPTAGVDAALVATVTAFSVLASFTMLTYILHDETFR